MTGVDYASSCYACVWCKCPFELRWDTSLDWSITNAEDGAKFSISILVVHGDGIVVYYNTCITDVSCFTEA